MRILKKQEEEQKYMENKKLGQEPAFATSALLSKEEDIYQAGMSKRFYAACAAMQGSMYVYLGGEVEDYSYEDFAKDCYRIADELLKQENE